MIVNILIGLLAWTCALPAVWMWSVLISNYAYPIRVFSRAEPQRKSIPASCGVQMWLPEE